ncbi:uncharacterized protein LOC130782239 [Actinidia eriantha]|uniref:uncharacterized protein LOC130782239 n=1 Tax=Actinidia eriantha TaxID=165200 RepID=UPI00258F000A|nr:uncharacterized protein LOC130782239 [Actinidia eriantha]
MAKIEKWKDLWETWDLRLVILISLILQTFLIFSAPLRKRMSTAYIVMPMWLTYLLTDATANFVLGLISKSQGDDTSGPFKNPDLLAFWALFLLVCLGGLNKYTERTCSLYLACTRKFRESLLTEPDPGPNYAKLMDEYTSKKEARLPTKIEMIPEPRRDRLGDGGKSDEWSDLEVVQCAYRYFDTFKGLIADLIFRFRERNQTRDFFLKGTARDAFKVVEVELIFFYEILYTKVAVVQAIVLFLLFGAIALDLIAFVMVIYSDWTAMALTKSENPYRVTDMLRTALNVKRVRWPKKPGKPWTFSFGFGTIMKIVRRRWSESLSKYNLINYVYIHV